jgi:hypothetical protein
VVLSSHLGGIEFVRIFYFHCVFGSIAFVVKFRDCLKDQMATREGGSE